MIDQLTFDMPGPQVLIDHAAGRMVYTDDFLDRGTAAAWFDVLNRSIPWQAHRRRMYDRNVDVPRLTAHYLLDSPALPPVLMQAAELLRDALNTPFNSVGLNLYRNGSDSVAPHNDTLEELAPQQPIALLSLGAVRSMTIRAKQPPRHVMRLDLQPGSLLVMDWRSQLNYDHGIPKQQGVAESRISLAFRVRKID